MKNGEKSDKNAKTSYVTWPSDSTIGAVSALCLELVTMRRNVQRWWSGVRWDRVFIGRNVGQSGTYYKKTTKLVFCGLSLVFRDARNFEDWSWSLLQFYLSTHTISISFTITFRTTCHERMVFLFLSFSIHYTHVTVHASNACLSFMMLSMMLLPPCLNTCRTCSDHALRACFHLYKP